MESSDELCTTDEEVEVKRMLKISFVDLSQYISLNINTSSTVQDVINEVLRMYANTEIIRNLELKNYGLFYKAPPFENGVFLDAALVFSSAPFSIYNLQFKEKHRVWRLNDFSDEQLRKMNNKNNRKKFLSYVKAKAIDKMRKSLDRGFDPNYIDSESGETPLTLATSVKNATSLIYLLVDGGAILDFKNKKGCTAVHCSALFNNVRGLTMLFEMGASPNYVDEKGVTVLHQAVQLNCQISVIDCLLKNGAKIGISGASGWQEIHYACKVGNEFVVEKLLFYGADINAQTSALNTPLHICALYNKEMCARVLLMRGAEKTLLNESQQNAHQVAIVSSNVQLGHTIHAFSSDSVVEFNNRNVDLGHGNLRRLSVASYAATKHLDQPDSPSPSSGNSRFDYSPSVTDRLTNLLSMQTEGEKRVMYEALPNTFYVCCRAYQANTLDELSLKKGDKVQILNIGEGNYLHGRVNDSEGWFPANYIEPITDNTSFGKATKRRRSSKNFGPRDVKVKITKKGLGFVVRGTSVANYVPSPAHPAYNYFEDVKKGGAADKAGIKERDFILKINGEDVKTVLHAKLCEIIRACKLYITFTVLQASKDYDSSNYGTIAASPNYKRTPAPRPPERSSRTSLSWSKSRSPSVDQIHTLFEGVSLDDSISGTPRLSNQRRRPPSLASHQLFTSETSLNAAYQAELSRQSLNNFRSTGAFSSANTINFDSDKGHQRPPLVPTQFTHQPIIKQSLRNQQSNNTDALKSAFYGISSQNKKQAPPPPTFRALPSNSQPLVVSNPRYDDDNDSVSTKSSFKPNTLARYSASQPVLYPLPSDPKLKHEPENNFYIPPVDYDTNDDFDRGKENNLPSKSNGPFIINSIPKHNSYHHSTGHLHQFSVNDQGYESASTSPDLVHVDNESVVDAEADEVYPCLYELKQVLAKKGDISENVIRKDLVRDNFVKSTSSQRQSTSNSLPSNPLEWSNIHVLKWLESVNMGEYSDTFQENDIRGSHLRQLSKSVLAELGVSRMGHRLTLESAIKKLFD